MQQQVRSGLATVRRTADDYRGADDRPLGGYLAIMTTFTGLVTGAAWLARSQGRGVPQRVGPWDVLLLAAASHKLSRTLSKDAVTAPLRAPFTRYTGRGGPAEVREEVRSSNGVRHSIGELLTCPFCLDVWIVTALTIGLVFAPRATRLVAAAAAALTGSDFLQLAYARAQQAAGG